MSAPVRIVRVLASLVASFAFVLPPARGQETGVAAEETPPLMEFDLFGRHVHVPGWQGFESWAELRFRSERFHHLRNPGQDSTQDFEHLRFRHGLSQVLGPAEIGFEWQTMNVFGVDPDAAVGPAGLYLGVNRSTSPESISVRQGWVEVDLGGPTARFGRQLVAEDSGLRYDDAAFQMVRDRGNARLVGNLDWVAGGRSYDGVTLASQGEEWVARAFGLEVNRGAFDVEHQGQSLDDVQIGGLELSNRRGALVPGTELGAFAYVFHDERAVTIGALGDELLAQTLGGRVATRGKIGPGHADLFLWYARQHGDSGGQRLQADAWIAEAGYQLGSAPLKPWVRVGHARGSGDGSATDGASNNFHNGVPTNHTYYGYADLFALTNLRNTYVDLILSPAPDVKLAATFHDFALNDDGAGFFAGSGPFNEAAFGYAATAVTSRNLGQELDLTLRVTSSDRGAWVLLGYSRFWGDTAFERLFTRDDVSFAYVEVGWRL
jgi:hypothetical protein